MKNISAKALVSGLLASFSLFSCGGGEGTEGRPINRVPLDPPVGFEAHAVSDKSVRLDWVADTSVDSFQIQRRTGTSEFVAISSPTAAEGTFTDTGLRPVTSYEYRICAFAGGRQSDYSTKSVVTLATAMFVPTAPFNLAVTSVTNATVSLRWETDADNDEYGFRIERASGACSTYAPIGEVPADVAQFTDTGLTASTTYCYRVYAYNNIGDSPSFASVSCATTGDATGRLIPSVHTGFVSYDNSGLELTDWFVTDNPTQMTVEHWDVEVPVDDATVEKSRVFLKFDLTDATSFTTARLHLVKLGSTLTSNCPQLFRIADYDLLDKDDYTPSPLTQRLVADLPCNGDIDVDVASVLSIGSVNAFMIAVPGISSSRQWITYAGGTHSVAASRPHLELQ